MQSQDNRFQLRLSSAVIIMIAAGGLVSMDAWVIKNFQNGYERTVVLAEVTVLQIAVLSTGVWLWKKVVGYLQHTAKDRE